MKSKPIYNIFAPGISAGVAFKNKSLKKSIIRYLDLHQHSTISDLSGALKISGPKVNGLVNDLIADGLVTDAGKLDSTGGRRAMRYSLVADAAYFLGIDVKKYAINIGLADLQKNLIYSKNDIPFVLENTPESLKTIVDIVSAELEHLPVSKQKILGIGLNISGRINNATGYSYSYFNFQEEPLAAYLESRLGVPVFLENDSRAMALAEFSKGIVQQEKNIVYLNLDYGTGMGMVVNGNIYSGKSGFSGEIGHIPVYDNEIICQCGKKGCLETEASGDGIIRNVIARIKNGSTSSLSKSAKHRNIKLEDVVDAALREDTLAIECIEEMGEKLGRALAIILNILNPELVILGGTLGTCGDLIRLPVKSALNKYALSLVYNDSTIKNALLGKEAGVMGACFTAHINIVN